MVTVKLHTHNRLYQGRFEVCITFFSAFESLDVGLAGSANFFSSDFYTIRLTRMEK